MASISKPYRRLPGTGYRYVMPGWAIFLLFFVIGIFALLLRGRRVQLWQGEEHLLLVEWDGNREYYKRFDYHDIQAFIVRKTVEGKIISGLSAGLLILFSGLAIPASDIGLRIFLLILGGVFGLVLLGNVRSGPTCQCHVRTAVQTEQLPSLSRLRRAREVLDRIRPLITVAQGQLARDEIPARMQEWLAESEYLAAAHRGGLSYIVDDPNAPPRIVS